ncbi:MAG: two-component system, LytT family, response regulator [Bacteroidetes bacterium]|nr:MAG: two-component system, LytT family, response regulator [Bacteroidota bacterium]
MIRAVIIDDAPDARQSLADDIEKHCPQVNVVAEAESVASGIKAIQQFQPELVFLDIQLGDGTGFDMLEQIGNTTAKVIFTTGLDNQGIRAIKFSALDYLLKPVDPDELVAAVEKMKSAQTSGGALESLRLLTENLRQSQQSPKRIALNSADRVHVVQVSEIIRCTSERNYTIFFIKGGKQIVVTRTLKEYEEMLEPSGFVRVHHSHLINLEHLREFVKADGGYALMNDGSHVPVSVRKREELMKALGLD